MNRRRFLRLTGLSTAPLFIATARTRGLTESSARRQRSFDLEDATIAELQSAMASGEHSAVSLAARYLNRIEGFDRQGPAVNSVIEINPDALALARALDEERKARGPRGPLHGLPMLLKDNIDTHDRMMTTAGSLALNGSIPARDSFVAQRLRDAGAVILGKTNLSEWANFRSNRSTSGWSGRGGLTKNPYALDRNPSGSSSGSAAAVSANLCVAAIGTETNGSIVSPATVCGIVGLKPTVGLISRAGIIPISHSQDTAGPMTRTVRDAAIVLSALTGIDPRDAATESSQGKAHPDYSTFLNPDGLRGARLGIVRRSFGSRAGGSENGLEAALEEMRRLGAVLVDLTEIPNQGEVGGASYDVMLYEFKAGFNAYLAGLGENAPVRSLKEVIEFNERNKEKEMPHFGQEVLLRSEDKGPLTEKAYLDALEKCRNLSRARGIDAVMDEHQLDALVAPSGGPAAKTDLIYGDRGVGGSSTPAAVAGYPNITVPAGEVHGLPFGISFFGRAYSEPVLLRLAYAFEQATQTRQPPKFLPTVG